MHAQRCRRSVGHRYRSYLNDLLKLPYYRRSSKNTENAERVLVTSLRWFDELSSPSGPISLSRLPSLLRFVYLSRLPTTSRDDRSFLSSSQSIRDLPKAAELVFRDERASTNGPLVAPGRRANSQTSQKGHASLPVPIHVGEKVSLR